MESLNVRVPSEASACTEGNYTSKMNITAYMLLLPILLHLEHVEKINREWNPKMNRHSR
jgi:hypothetical protein